MNTRPLIGLAGMVLAVSFSELNDQVVSAALPDVSGGLGIGFDAANWLRTVYLTGLVIGMCTGPSLAVVFSMRRFILFAIALASATSVSVPACEAFAANALPLLYLLRVLQGFGEAFIISNLIAVSLKVLEPSIRLYGLAFYAMTATLIPSLATPLAALWIGVIDDWRFIFFEVLALAPIAALLVWYGMEQDPPDYDRLRHYDWPGAVLVTLGFGTLSVVLQEGDHFDWFNSVWVTLGLLLSAVAIPLFLIVEMRTEVPLIRLDLFKRRNFAYSSITLVLFLIISLSASQVPSTFLREVQGYRPEQTQLLSLAVGLPQILLLPATAWLLDFKWVDSRIVSAVGLLCVAAACVLGALITSTVNRDQFILPQLLQAVGQPLIVMPLLMMATNALVPEEGPFASALVNTPRAISEAVGVGVLALITRLQGALHRDRIADTLGQVRLDLLPVGALPASVVQPSPGPNAPGSPALAALDRLVQAEVATLTTIDIYLFLGALAVVLLLVLVVLPERTYPPRIALAKK